MKAVLEAKMRKRGRSSRRGKTNGEKVLEKNEKKWSDVKYWRETTSRGINW